jgi:hypothetical protein
MVGGEEYLAQRGGEDRHILARFSGALDPQLSQAK